MCFGPFPSTDDYAQTMEALNPSAEVRESGSRFFLPRSLFSKVNDHPGADAQVVLVVVASIVEGGQQVVGLDESHRESRCGAQVEASAEVARKGCTGVGGSWIRSLNQRSA